MLPALELPLWLRGATSMQGKWIKLDLISHYFTMCRPVCHANQTGVVYLCPFCYKAGGVFEVQDIKASYLFVLINFYFNCLVDIWLHSIPFSSTACSKNANMDPVMECNNDTVILTHPTNITYSGDVTEVPSVQASNINDELFITKKNFDIYLPSWVLFLD